MFIGLSITACDGNVIENSERKVDDQLDRVHADQRAAKISDVDYILSFDLASDENLYRAHNSISFNLNNLDSAITIDFSGGTILNLTVNNMEQTADYNGFFITIQPEILQLGENQVEISYSHIYNHDGTGLHKFIDPEDGKTYLYSYLWPYYANRLFPAFDQPNLKATYTLDVTVPATWVVSSAMHESSVEQNGDVATWHFPQSPKFSTYILPLHAGEYKVWDDIAHTSRGEVPIRLFARQSLARYVDVEEWFTYTKQGLNFYGDYFDIAYPFHKYDQFLVPDFNIGAMENVAAVTFAENYVQRGTSNRFQRERRASTILHEMAHMWFGDLVTKNWWNGLWLNESFATYMSALARSEATEFKDSWHGFYMRSNLSAFGADSMVTTHPIEVPVGSTADFFSVFDSITYGKGASALNQLSHVVGAENYRVGVSNYLKENSYSNTELADFMRFQSAEYGKDLTPWADEWLYNAGVNTLEPVIACENGFVTSLGIKQAAPEAFPTLRSHSLQVGLYKIDDDALTNIALLPVTVSGALTDIPQAVGLTCPQIIDPNDGDWTYAKLILDKDTIANLQTLMPEIDSPLRRSMYWYSLGQMAGKGQMSHDQLLDLISANLETESNIRVYNQILGILAGSVGQMNRLGKDYDISNIENQLHDMVHDQTIGVDYRNLAFKSFIRYADGKYINSLKGLLSGDINIEGLEIDQELRWTIITKLNRDGYDGASELLAQEKLNDPSYSGIASAFAAQASQAELAIKEKWLSIFLDDHSEVTASQQKSAMNNLFPSTQSELQGQMLEAIVAALPTLGQTRDAYYLRDYTNALLAGTCTNESVAILAAGLEEGVNTNPTVVKFLREAHQRDAACAAQR